MKKFTAFGCALVLLALAWPATAQQGTVSSTATTYKVTAWPAEFEECFEHCENAGIIAPRSKTAGTSDDAARRQAREAKLKADAAQATARSGLANLGKLRGEIDSLRKRVKALEDEVGLLKSGQSQGRAALLQRIDELKIEVDAKISLVLTKLAQVESRLDANGHQEAQGDLNSLSTEIDNLKRIAERPLRFGPEAGFLLVNASSNGHVTTYTGFPVGAVMSFGLNDRVTLVLSADVLLANAAQPFGTQTRVMLRQRLGDRGLGIGYGLSGSFVGFDRRLDAAAAYVMSEGEAGFQRGSFRIGLGLLLGLGLHHDFGPGFAYGATARIGCEF